jgi:sugar/nucleoside kinase (ribokinase family)
VLCAVGDLVEDVVVWLADRPRTGTDTTARIYRRRGGSAANVTAFAASAGIPARFIGRVGDDALGSRLVDDLAAGGVDVRVQRAGRTGTIVVLVDPSGERTMLPDRGAATELAGVPHDWLDAVSLLHVPAYSLVVEPLASTCLGVAASVRAGGGRVSVDASSVAVLEQYGVAPFRQLVRRLAPDVLFANAAEAHLLGDEPSLAPLVVVKDGPNPVTLRPGGAVAVAPVAAVVDTTGAGDAFAAGFLSVWMDGADARSAAVRGNALAATTLSVPGAVRCG